MGSCCYLVTAGYLDGEFLLDDVTHGNYSFVEIWFWYLAPVSLHGSHLLSSPGYLK